MLIHNDPNNMNSIVYHLIIERYSMKTLHWYFPWATALHLYNMTGRGEKLQQLHYYHPFSDSLDIYLTKNHYENYSPKMVPIAKIWGSGSWTKSLYAYNETTPIYLKYQLLFIAECCCQVISRATNWFHKRLLTHWGRVTHICVSKLTIIGSDNGLSPGRRQAIIRTSDGILLIGPIGTNCSEMLIFSFKKIHFEMSSGKWRPFCLGLNVLTVWEQLL